MMLKLCGCGLSTEMFRKPLVLEMLFMVRFIVTFWLLTEWLWPKLTPEILFRWLMKEMLFGLIIS